MARGAGCRGRGHRGPGRPRKRHSRNRRASSDTPWLLYIVIAISAAVIIGAVPLLIRARRDAMSDAEPPARTRTATTAGATAGNGRGDATQTEKLRISGTTAGRIHAGPGYAAAVTHSTSLPAPLVAAIDQVWLRCAVLIACAIGIAMVAIGVATYLMAVESDVAAWVLLRAERPRHAGDAGDPVVLPA